MIHRTAQRVLLFLALAIAPACIAESLELGILREKKDIELTKIHKQYLAALEKLKVKHTKEGKIDAAVAVADEIDRTKIEIKRLAEPPNRFIGRWESKSKGVTHYRVFTRDTCTLYREKTKVWEHKYQLKSAKVAVADGGNIVHKLRDDGKLDCEGVYVATRVRGD